MGSSHSTPSSPVSCTVLQRKSTTRLFTVPRFSEWARTPAGTALHFDYFHFRGIRRQLKVYPAGFSGEDGAKDFVAVFIHGDHASAASSTKISVEILDACGESAVFDGHTARSEQTLLDGGEDMGYVRFVERRELEESQCVRADGSFTVRCTVSSNREMTKSIAKAAAFSMSSDRLRRSPRPPSLSEYCTWRKTKSTTRLFAVTEFSSGWARTPAGHALNFKPITFRDSSWRLRLFPAGLEDAAAGDSVAVFVSSERWTLLKDTRMSIEILERSGGRAALDDRTAESELTMMEHMSGGFWHCKEYMKGYVRFAGRKELQDSFTIRCTLSADEVVAKWLTRRASPPASCSRIAKQKRAKNILY